MAKPPYNTAGWRKVRQVVLERDGYECRVRLPGCLGKADAVDHIATVMDGGPQLDPLNLRATCTPCNTARRNKGHGVDPTPLPPSREW